MLPQFLNKTAVITGAASGLGKEVAKLGARMGMNMVLVDFNEQALASAAEDISKSSMNSSQKSILMTANVADFDRMKEVAKMTEESFGTPHFVFNNAGIARSGFTWEHSPEEWRKFLDINVMGVVHGIHVFTPMMLEAAKKDPLYRGRIINTASMAGLASMPLAAMYNVSKHAVVTLSETLYHDLNFVTNQVRTSVLCPFFVPTNIDKAASSPLSEAGHTNKGTVSQQVGDAFTKRAVSSGKKSAADVAELVFDAIIKDQFYIFSHPDKLGVYEVRSQDILKAQNPTDPYVTKPEIGEQIGKTLRESYGFGDKGSVAL